MAKVATMAVLGLFLADGKTSACGSGNDRAKLGLHVATLDSEPGDPCAQSYRPPCDEGVPSLDVHAPSGRWYRIYVYVLDATVQDGVCGVEFGISYDADSLSVTDWKHCSDGCTFTSEDWPRPGSSGGFTWLAETNCQNIPAPGDLNQGVTALIGAFDVHAIGSGGFEVAPRYHPNIVPKVRMSDCQSVGTEIAYPLHTGRVSFGGDPGFILDPCRGPFSPFDSFQDLPEDALGTLQVRIMQNDTEGRNPAVVLQGPRAVASDSLFLPFKRHRVGYISTPGPHLRVPVSLVEMQGILEVLAHEPEFDQSPARSLNSRFMTITVLSTFGAVTRAFEGFRDRDSGRRTIAAIRRAIQGNEKGRRLLDLQACMMGIGDPNGPAYASSVVHVDVGAWNPDPGGPNRVRSRIRVTNAGAVSLEAPVTLTMKAIPGVDILEPEIGGWLCRSWDGMRWYVDLEVGEAFEPKESVELPLLLVNSYGDSLRFLPQILAGYGMR